MKKMNRWILVLTMITGTASAATVTISVDGEKLAYKPTAFTVKAGEKVTLIFKNASKTMQHNLVIAKPGTADKVSTDSLAAGAEKGWTSAGPEVLFKSALLDPAKSETMTFEAPKDKGEFPFLCTFPGHGAVMRGKMNVK